MTAGKEIIIRPDINYEGYTQSVRDYKEFDVAEELAANSYDADASVFLVLLDSTGDKLYFIDDGVGIEDFNDIATLGASKKRGAKQYSTGNRFFLGQYGFGLKSTINIAETAIINSFRNGMHSKVGIDWTKLAEVMDGSLPGFQVAQNKSTKKIQGTHIALGLKSPTDKSHLKGITKALDNLPNEGGAFNCYVGMYDDVSKEIPNNICDFISNLKSLCKKWVKSAQIESVHTNAASELGSCKKHSLNDKLDKSVSATIYFTKMDRSGKVDPLKKSLRGIYVRIKGRLLKQDFNTDEFTSDISKWASFKHGTRVELHVDWLRDQITLSRDGVRFSNDKLKAEFGAALSRIVRDFINPLLEKKKLGKKREAKKKADQRDTLLGKRKKRQPGCLIPGIKNGFNFHPNSDAELALVLSHQDVISKVSKDYVLLDYDDQSDYDCTILDQKTKDYIRCELEPKLTSFLEHNDSSRVELIIVWTISGWKLGSGKKGKPGYLKLISDKDHGGKKGRYKLLESASEKSKSPRKEYPVIALDEVLK